MSTVWVKATDSVEFSEKENEVDHAPKSQNWIQQGLARINTKRRIKRYGSCKRSVDDYSRFFLHVVS